MNELLTRQSVHPTGCDLLQLHSEMGENRDKNLGVFNSNAVSLHSKTLQCVHLISAQDRRAIIEM